MFNTNFYSPLYVSYAGILHRGFEKTQKKFIEGSIGEYLKFPGIERMTPNTLWRPEGLWS